MVNDHKLRFWVTSKYAEADGTEASCALKKTPDTAARCTAWAGRARDD